MDNFLTTCKSCFQLISSSYEKSAAGISHAHHYLVLKFMPDQFPINPKILGGIHYKGKRGFHFRGPPDPFTLLREQTNSVESYVQLFKGINLKPGSLDRTRYEHFFEDLLKYPDQHPKLVLNGELQSLLYWCEQNKIPYRFPRSDKYTAEFVNQTLLNMEEQARNYSTANAYTNFILCLCGVFGLAFLFFVVHSWLYPEETEELPVVLNFPLEPTIDYVELYQLTLLYGTATVGLIGLYFLCYTLFKFRSE